MEMANVMVQKIVTHVQMIVARVLPWNIAVTMFVITEKIVIHVGQIVQNVQTLVEICFATQPLKHVRVVRLIVELVLDFVEMGLVIVQMNHVETVHRIVGTALPMMYVVTVLVQDLNHVLLVSRIVDLV